MDILLNVTGQVKVDDMLHIRNVQASSSNLKQINGGHDWCILNTEITTEITAVISKLKKLKNPAIKSTTRPLRSHPEIKGCYNLLLWRQGLGCVLYGMSSEHPHAPAVICHHGCWPLDSSRDEDNTLGHPHLSLSPQTPASVNLDLETDDNTYYPLFCVATGHCRYTKAYLGTYCYLKHSTNPIRRIVCHLPQPTQPSGWCSHWYCLRDQQPRKCSCVGNPLPASANNTGHI